MKKKQTRPKRSDLFLRTKKNGFLMTEKPDLFLYVQKNEKDFFFFLKKRVSLII